MKNISRCWVPIIEEDSKKMFGFYNKLLKNSKDSNAKVLGEYGEKNMEFLAKDFVKKRCEGVLENNETK